MSLRKLRELISRILENIRYADMHPDQVYQDAYENAGKEDR